MSDVKLAPSILAADFARLGLHLPRHAHLRGLRAPHKGLQEKFGFEPDHVATCARELLGKQ